MIFDPDYQDILKSFSVLVTDDPQGTLKKISSLLSKDEIKNDNDIYALLKSREALCYKTLYDTMQEAHYLDDAIAAFKESLNITDEELLMADISYELGLAYAEKAYLYDSESIRLKAISHLEKAALQYSIDQYPEDYGSIHWNMGVLYHDLAEKTDSLQSYLTAIEHYNMAKNVFTKEQYPSRYAEMANSLGLAYTDLAHANTDSIEYLASALSSFIDAIDIYEQSYDMDNYGSALVNAALTCIDIFDGVGDEEYVVQAIDLLKQAKGILFDERGEEYTKALYNLAIASMKFSRLHSDSSYVVEAINNLKELMSLSGSSKDMHLFAAASYEAGRAYHYLYSLQEEKGLLEEAIDMYTTSMNYSEDGTPSQELAATYLYLGDAKTELGIVSNEASHIKESLEYFDGAIRCYGTQVPSALGTATLHKAMAEQSLYDINADENHLINAVKLYESALIIFKDVTDAIAEISSLLAEVYMLLYDTACDVGHLKRAHELYVDALDYFSKDNASERHEFIKGRLEDIRKKLEEV